MCRRSWPTWCMSEPRATPSSPRRSSRPWWSKGPSSNRRAGGGERKGVREIEVPRSVRSVVGQRVGRLSVGAQEVLRVASILGQEWELDLLVGTAGQDEETVMEHLDAA